LFIREDRILRSKRFDLKSASMALRHTFPAGKPAAVNAFLVNP
jgi:hypothetical protein